MLHQRVDPATIADAALAGDGRVDGYAPATRCKTLRATVQIAPNWVVTVLAARAAPVATMRIASPYSVAPFVASLCVQLVMIPSSGPRQKQRTGQPDFFGKDCGCVRGVGRLSAKS